MQDRLPGMHQAESDCLIRNQLLQQAKGKTEILEGAAQQIVKLLKRETVIYDVKNGKLGQPLHTIPQGGEILVEE